VLVGSDAKSRPTAWTSADGVTWRARPLGGHGDPEAVVSKGATVVVVGEKDDTYATWVSNDRGQTWKRGSTPPKPSDDDDYSRSIADVTATEDGFVAVGSYFAEQWEPVVYRSTNGSSWQQDRAPSSSEDGADGSIIRAGASEEVAVTHE
jgi:hypothetical protein